MLPDGGEIYCSTECH